jgi:hypothetical protein
MAYNLNILTSYAKVSQVELEYYFPSATVQGSPVGAFYAFLGQEDSWPVINGVETPTQPTEDQTYLKKVFKNMFAAKLINSSNMSPVIQRINWANNTNYFAYMDNVDVQAKDANGFLVHNFYIKNRFDQVFKCLANNNSGLSTSEPFFQPGSYGTNNIYEGSDLYKWKYMYTIDAGSKNKFMDSAWMPVPIGANTPQPYLTKAGWGDIEVINVLDGGSGYDAVNQYITVTVTGDGVGANGSITSPQIVGGIIKDITVTNAGNNYTYANVSVNAYTSANLKFLAANTTPVIAIAPTSPIGGHAYDPISELGCSNIMFSVEFNGSENGVIPTTGVNYRQVGLILNPQVYGSSGPTLAKDAIYNLATQFILSAGAGNIYVSDEIVRQIDFNNNLLFSGTVLSFNSSTNVLQIINTYGTPVIGQSVIGQTSGASRVLFSESTPTMIPFSGLITYIENRAGVLRSADGIEQFKFILGY